MQMYYNNNINYTYVSQKNNISQFGMRCVFFEDFKVGFD